MTTPRSLLAALLLASLVATDARAQDIIREEVKRAAPTLTRPPRLLRFVSAEYPAAAKERRVSGAVNLMIEIDAKGGVTRVEVLQSPDPVLSAAAAAAAKQFRFTPAEVDGKPAPVRIQYAYNFVIGIDFKPRLPDWMQERRAAAVGADVLVGRVREQGTRLPMPGVAVSVSAVGVEVRTDDRGAFAIKSVPPGKYKVQAISLEHKREVVDAEIKRGEQTRIEFYLQRLTVNPYETVVRGTRRKTVVTRISLREKELTTVPGTFGDPIRVVENLPGVARTPYIGGALLIRGAAPQDSGVYLDGIKVPILYHFLGGPSVLHPEFIDRIDYYPGNVDVRYGRLIAGVVDVGTRNSATQQWGGSVDINLLNSGVQLKVPLSKRVTLSVAARRSYIDAILPSILKASSNSATTIVPIYYDYQLRLDVQLPRDNQLFFLVFGSDDSLGIATNDPSSTRDVSLESHIAFHRILARWRWQISDRLVSKLTPAFGVDWISFDTGISNAKLRQLDFALREDLELRVSRRLTLRAGVDFDVVQGTVEAKVPLPLDYRNPGSGNNNLFSPEAQPYNIDTQQIGLGAYVDGLINVTRRLQLIPGARFEMFRYYGRTAFSVDPRLTARFTLSPKTTFKAAAGLYSQAPAVEGGFATAQFGNPNLNPEHAVHLSLGGEQRLLPSLSLDAQAFYIHRYDLIVPSTQVSFGDSQVHVLRYTNQGSGYSYGLEVLLKHDVTRRFYGWLAYTLSQTKVQRQAGGDFVLFSFDQTHILTLVASVRLGVGWELGARFRLVSGRPDTPVIGGIFDNDRNRYRRLDGDARSTRFPLFHQLDLRVEKTWFFKLWRLTAYLDVQNVYNAENPEAILFDYRFSASGYLRGLPVLPSFGVRGSF
jgi:TonB family protein